LTFQLGYEIIDIDSQKFQGEINMRGSDVNIGDFVQLKSDMRTSNDPHCKSSNSTYMKQPWPACNEHGTGLARGRKTPLLLKGTEFECVHKMPNPARWATNVVSILLHHESGGYFMVSDHTRLKPSEGSGSPTSGMNDRQKKAFRLEKSLEQDNQRVAKAIKDLEALKNQIEHKSNRLNDLKEFESDEDALAHALSEIVKSGGDVAEIAKVLKRHGETCKL
tara:strand:+ start:23900 stop:24562 length:663 start_codon:yes stop_codon:yes gene_type:complete